MAAGEAGYALRPVEATTPVEVFERRWAMTVLDRALDRLQEESALAGGAAHFAELKQFLTSSEPQATYREVAAATGMSEGAVATAVHRLRQRYGRCLRAEIVETVVDPADVNDELRHMLAVVRA